MIEIDGTFGEGGGQILRTSLALSVVTGEPFRIRNIRGRRRKPGLRRQHLTAVQAARAISGGSTAGAELGSGELVFEPAAIVPGEHRFAVGTAGSAGLVLQTVLPALLTAPKGSRLVLEGGTHNPWAPPFDFLDRAYLPLLRRLGPGVTALLERPGFYPAGGGRFEVEVEPVAQLTPLDLPERGAIVGQRAMVLLANLPEHIGRRELAVVARKTGWERDRLELLTVPESKGPGNAVMIELEGECVTEVFTAFGARGVRAENVAEQVVSAARRYQQADVAVGEHLADQLLLPLALAGGGSFTTLPLTMHTTTNIEVIREFLEVSMTTEELGPNRWRITVSGNSA
jgi:RNA 3'-terminal phosphate cyclase (ATP)